MIAQSVPFSTVHLKREGGNTYYAYVSGEFNGAISLSVACQLSEIEAKEVKISNFELNAV